MFKPTDHEMKVMRYLHQHGLTERRNILVDCASENSVIGMRGRSTFARRRFYNGSNGAAPMIVARWMRRLIAEGLAREKRSQDRYYSHRGFELTPKGHQFVRDFHAAEPSS